MLWESHTEVRDSTPYLEEKIGSSEVQKRALGVLWVS